MFSSITIDASSTIPTAKARPASDITFNVLPVISITLKLVIRQIGIDIATINVAGNLAINRNKIAIEREIPKPRLFLSIFIERSIYTVSS